MSAALVRPKLGSFMLLTASSSCSISCDLSSFTESISSSRSLLSWTSLWAPAKSIWASLTESGDLERSTESWEILRAGRVGAVGGRNCSLEMWVLLLRSWRVERSSLVFLRRMQTLLLGFLGVGASLSSRERELRMGSASCRSTMCMSSLSSKLREPFWISFSRISRLSFKLNHRWGRLCAVLILWKPSSLAFQECSLQQRLCIFSISRNSLPQADSSRSLLFEPRFSISTNLSMFFSRSATFPVENLPSFLSALGRGSSLLGGGETVGAWALGLRLRLKLISFCAQDKIYRSALGCLGLVSFCDGFGFIVRMSIITNHYLKNCSLDCRPRSPNHIYLSLSNNNFSYTHHCLSRTYQDRKIIPHS